MSSRNDRFECRWQCSRALLTAYCGAQLLALISLLMLNIPVWAKAVGALLCLLHGVWGRAVSFSGERVFTGLRRDSTGWHMWNQRDGWQPVQLRPDSLALPRLIVIRFRVLSGHALNRIRVRSVCIPRDALAPDTHRRLRLRLKFSRRRWAAPE